MLTNFNSLNLQSGTLKLNSTIESTSTSTGTLITNGGVGISGNLNIGGSYLSLNNESDTGSNILIKSLEPNLLTSSNVNLCIGKSSTNGNSAVLSYSHVGDNDPLNEVILGTYGNAQIELFNNGVCVLPCTLNSTDTASGALQISGGIGIAKDLYIGGTLHSTLMSSATTSINWTYDAATFASTLNIRTSSSGLVWISQPNISFTPTGNSTLQLLIGTADASYNPTTKRVLPIKYLQGGVYKNASLLAEASFPTFVTFTIYTDSTYDLSEVNLSFDICYNINS